MIDYNKLKFVLNLTMKKLLIFLIFTFTLSSNATSKETTYKKELFDQALLEGKVVVVSSWIKYCTSCASQMKILNKAKNDFDNIEGSCDKAFAIKTLRFIPPDNCLNL